MDTPLYTIKVMPPKGPPKGKGKGLKHPPKPPRGISAQLSTPAFKGMSLPSEPSEPSEPFMYMKPPEPFMKPPEAPYMKPDAPPPFHPENIVYGPTRIMQKGPSSPWLQALETPRRLKGKQEEPLWMSAKDAKAENARAVRAYKRDTLGRFLGGKGAWA